MKRSDRQVLIAVGLGAAVLGFALMAYIFSGRADGPTVPAQQAAATPAPATAAAATPAPAEARDTAAQKSDAEGSSIPSIFGADPESPERERTERWTTTVLRILFRLALAAALAAALAFRPRKDLPILQRNLYVAQTQILLAVVASSLMMVVGDNAARAFGIFAAVSLVRFRTNIRDPKEITVLLISLSLGLATGVGRWELAIILTLFVYPLLWVLERREPEEVFRAMELTVKTRDADRTQAVLRSIFDRYQMSAEMRQVEPPTEAEPVGSLMYHVRMNLNVSTDELNERILSVDGGNVDAVEWKQQKNTGYVYN